jgi:hypothetical protein
VSNITAYNELADLLELRIGKLLRNDEVYQEMYQKRLMRLDAIRSEIAQSMSTLAETAISATRSSHALADALAVEIRKGEALTIEDDAQRVERLVAWHRDRIARSNPREVSDRLDRLQSEAYKFMRWTVSPKAATDTRPLREIIDDQFREEREIDRMVIAATVNRLLMARQSRSTQLALLPPVALLGRTYRGLLYAGIMDRTGSRLEWQDLRQDLRRLLRGAATDIAGHFVPLLGLLTVVAEFLNLIEPDRLPPSVEAAREVEDYLAKYNAVMHEWITAANRIVEMSRKTREVLDSA